MKPPITRFRDCWYNFAKATRSDLRAWTIARHAYNTTVVYNHKRHGAFVLGGRAFDFGVKPSFPKALSTEFLLVDLVSNVDRLAENRDEVLSRVKERAASSDRTRLRRAAERYGNVRAKKFFREILRADMAPHVR